MNKQKEFFQSTNGSDKICYYRYTPDTEVQGIFQLVHGMAEHGERYEGFAEYLCERGFAVYIHEHVGHGGSASSKDRLGMFLDAKQASVMVEDAKKMTGIAKLENPGKKLVLFGHSMGSFVVRLYAAKYSSEIDGLVICGSGAKNRLAGVANVLIKTMKVFKGKDYQSKLIDKLSFGKFNDRYDNSKTAFDWLSRDERVVNDYIASDYCGFLFSLDGMLMILDVNVNSNRPEAFKSVRNDLPIFIVSGDMDPVGDYGEGVKKVYDSFIDAGMKNCKMKLYPGARHEILNETNKQEVYGDIVEFASKIAF